MEVSNKLLAWLVVATIVISMTGTMLSLNRINKGVTGYAVANATGNVSVTVASQTSLTFLVGATNFGSGSVDGAYTNCTLYVNRSTAAATNVSIGCQGFSNTTPLVLENNGNTVINVTLNFTNNASTFIGGGGVGAGAPQFKFQVYENETGTCASLNVSVTNFTEVSPVMVGGVVPICYGMNWQNTNDTLGIGIWVTIPADASGTKNMTIIAQGTG